MIKRTYKSLSSSRLLKIWREERQARKDQAAREQLARDWSAKPLLLTPTVPAQELGVKPINQALITNPLSDKEARRLERRANHQLLRAQEEQERQQAKAPIHAFRLSEQPFYGIGRQDQDKVENPVKRPIDNEMIEWLNSKRISIHRLEEWRWLDSKLSGHINGFNPVELDKDGKPYKQLKVPNLSGRAMMANGVYVLVERPDGSVFWGHECHWIEDKDPNKPKRGGSENSKTLEIRAERLRELLAI